jgi:photosystem II stability/assembly factor-like uncharacterized protein
MHAQRLFSPRFLIAPVLTSAVLTIASIATTTTAFAQWVERPAPTSISMRGLSVLSKDVVWASGTKGTFLWTNDGGATWTVGTVPGAESFDFRDVHAVSLDTVYLMAAGQDTARIYKTTDRGKTWTLQYNDTRQGVFLNAIAFWDAQHGVALGDPIDGRFMILRTEDGGATWTQIDSSGLPLASEGEVAFAASGTALVVQGKTHAWFATGGASTSRVFASTDNGKSWKVYNAPVTANAQSKGIFSLAFWSATHGVAVGGDYAQPDPKVTTVAITEDGGQTWRAAEPSEATGYLSGVAVLLTDPKKAPVLIGVGTKGTAVSTDGGRTWAQRDTLSLNAIAVAPGSRTVWGVGPNGKIVVRSDL